MKDAMHLSHDNKEPYRQIERPQETRAGAVNPPRDASGRGNTRRMLPFFSRGSHVARRTALGALVSGALACTGAYLWSRRGGSLSNEESLGSPKPLSASYPPVRNPLSHEQRESLRRKFRLRSDSSVGTLLHWLRVFGTGPEAPAHDGEVRGLLSEVCDAARLKRRYRTGRSPLVRTAHGARYMFTDSVLPQPERGGHAYQTLAIFAELGLPASHPLTTSQGAGTVSDLLRDCLLNFQLREVPDIEPDWAAVAISLYLPPIRAWKNRWGENLTFDDLARYLLARPIGWWSCEGTHLLFALAALLQVHRQCPVLSRPTALKVDDFLAVTAALIERTQRHDGSWGSNWRGAASLETPATTLLITGHLLESSTYFPLSHQLRSDVVAKALGFLARTLEVASDADIATDYCPYSHAVRALLHCPQS